MIDFIAHQWLRSGWKYHVSAWAAGNKWFMPFSQVLSRHGIMLTGVRDLNNLVEAFRGRVFWKADQWFQLRDIVLPPDTFLAQGGDDCDGQAMFMATAINHTLSVIGWHARIVSAYVDPWQYSHHFAVGIDPGGVLHAIQPYPTVDQSLNQAVIWPRLYVSWDNAVKDVMKTSYNATVRGYDVRDHNWEIKIPWRINLT